jgi:hypothetical protein
MDNSAQRSLQEVEGQENLFNAVFHFLEHGCLPWYARLDDQQGLHEGLLLITSQPVWLARLIDLIGNNPRTFDRLLYQGNENVILSIVIRSGLETDLVISLRKFLTEIINRLKAASGLALTDDGTKYVVYSILLKATLDAKNTEAQKITWDIYFSKVIYLTVKKFSGNGINRLHAVLNESAFENFREKALKCIQVYSQDKVEIFLSEKSTVTFSSKREHYVTDLAEHGLFIGNAGLVLLHPFLTLLFENTGYIYNKAWTSEEHKQRALALTQFMITGADEFPEFDLALNKILIGYPMENTLPSEIQLSKFEKQEATDVLKSVIRHWVVLKDTSIEGLQSSLLRREGKLLLTESGWRLQIEHKTTDILVDRLPWSFSVVKTPWMDVKLNVDWSN